MIATVLSIACSSGLASAASARLEEADWFKGEWSTLRTYAILDREYAGRTCTP